MLPSRRAKRRAGSVRRAGRAVDLLVAIDGALEERGRRDPGRHEVDGRTVVADRPRVIERELAPHAHLARAAADVDQRHPVDVDVVGAEKRLQAAIEDLIKK